LIFCREIIPKIYNIVYKFLSFDKKLIKF